VTISRTLVLVMAVATGISVASNYYAQPLLPAIRHSIGISSGVAGLVVTVAQLGYAAGLVLILPLGDLLERRRLVVGMSLATAAGLAWFAAAPSAGALLPAAFVVGALSVVAQVLVPFAATLASDADRGRVVGTVMSGLLLGILLARTVAGYLAEAGGWRTIYWVAAGALVAQAVLLRCTLPRYREPVRLGYPALLGSVLRLMATEQVLRLRSLYGALSFGCFSVLWTSLAFLLAGSPYHYSTGTIGLFGLAGAAGAATASVAGRLADRGLVRLSTGGSAALLAAGWAALWLGRHSLAALLAGIVVVDIGAQGMHITNQSEVYRLRPEARSRLNSGYMTSYFIGGAIGSAGSAGLYGMAGWWGVSALGSGFAALTVLVSAADLLARRRSVPAGRRGAETPARVAGPPAGRASRGAAGSARDW
jgi:predicted MFS family arabinose efflux permease